ncbi:hypothetical protein [Aeromicrobium sp.]|jgi:hypothetical protein|uniref:hypothetical protein n=1 Tax=Aeromicrobium sp. TaxID=1871063 RepID=UPI002612DEAF|nr:hypothetical protein [Aeromicrobium sp.]
MTKPLLLARAALMRAFVAFDPQDAVRPRAAYATAGVAPVATTRDAGPHGRTRS